VAQSVAYQAVMAVAKGDHPGAEAALAPVAAELDTDTPGFGVEMVAFAAALLAESRDDVATAYRHLTRFWEYDRERDNRYSHRCLAPSLVRIALDLDDLEVARQVADVVEAGAALAPEVPSVQSAALRCRALVDQDPERMIEAVGLARLSPRVLDHNAACEDAARVLTATGRTTEAEALLTEALSRYDELGATAWAARVRRELRRLGVRGGSRGPRRRPKRGWESLTPTERAVSQLVAAGMTNREVAQRLHVSPHTVNTHLRHVFDKLSVSNRVELAATVIHATKAPD
jgi:DNA-binding CsgD family transcriptional regulator